MVIAGFLFTAIPNWTGRMPIRGLPLATLFVVWACGRLAVTFSVWLGWGVAMAIDLSFLVAIIAVVIREIVAGKELAQSENSNPGFRPVSRQRGLPSRSALFRH